MIFFIPPTAATSEEADAKTAQAAKEALENPGLPNPPGWAPIPRVLEVSCPEYNVENNIVQPTVELAVLAIAAKEEAPDLVSPITRKLTKFSSVLIDNVIFSTGTGAGVRIQDCDNVTVRGSYFRNFGNSNLVLINTTNTLIGGPDPDPNDTDDTMRNVFRGGYKGMVNVVPFVWRPYPFTGTGTLQGVNPSSFSDPLKVIPQHGRVVDYIPPSGPSVPYSTNDIPSNFATLTPSGLQIKDNDFVETGIIYPEVPALNMDSLSIGAQIEHNKFEKVAGAAIVLNGINNLVRLNDFKDCVLHQTDAGCVYIGKTFVQMFNQVSWNTFENTHNRTMWEGCTLPPAQQPPKPHLTDDVQCVFLDNLSMGSVVSSNTFGYGVGQSAASWHLQHGVKINGGAWHVMGPNTLLTGYTSANALKINGENGLGMDPSNLYQHYREMGELFQVPGVFLSNGHFNSAWTQRFSDLGDASQGFLNSFTGGEVNTWYKTLFNGVGLANWRLSSMPWSLFNSSQPGQFYYNSPPTGAPTFKNYRIAR